MKARFAIIVASLLASLLAMPAGAQPGPGMGGMGGMSGMGPGMGGGMMQGGGPRARAPRDCTQAPNPAACNAHREARAKALEACKDQAGPQRRQCMQEQRQNFDCSKSGNPSQCEARKQVYKACEGQVGPAFRQCVQQKMPPVDCSKAFDPARCDVHQKAREACKDKFGPEHRACVLQQLNVK
jgi:hypothetical protein